MSRYIARNSKNETVTYGYDNMLQEYFLFPENEDEPEINNRHAIVDYLDKGEFPIPQRHKENMLLDLPI